METILSTLVKLRIRKKLRSDLEAGEWKGFEGTDKLYYLKHVLNDQLLVIK